VLGKGGGPRKKGRTSPKQSRIRAARNGGGGGGPLGGRRAKPLTPRPLLGGERSDLRKRGKENSNPSRRFDPIREARPSKEARIKKGETAPALRGERGRARLHAAPGGGGKKRASVFISTADEFARGGKKILYLRREPARQRGGKKLSKKKRKKAKGIIEGGGLPDEASSKSPKGEAQHGFPIKKEGKGQAVVTKKRTDRPTVDERGTGVPNHWCEGVSGVHEKGQDPAPKKKRSRNRPQKKEVS